MQGSIEFGLPAARPRRFARELPAVATGAGPGVSFKLLILFLLMLYSNIAVIFPQLNVFRPVLVVAVGAVFMLVVELAQARQSFKLAWPQGYLLIAFLSVALVSSFNAIYARLAFDTTSDLSKIVLIYLLLENTITTEKRLRTIFLTIVIGGLFPALGTINNYMHGHLLEGSRAAWKGLFGNPNEDAYALAILIPIAAVLASKSRWLPRLALWAIMGAYLLAIFLTFSRGGMLGLFAMVGLIGWKQKSLAIRALLVAALAGSLLLAGLFWGRSQGFKNISKDTTFNQRLATIVAGALMFEDKPLFGVGPGCSVVAYPLYVPEILHCGCQAQLVIHNSFVQVLSEMGALGFIPFMALLGSSFFHLWKMQKGPLAKEAAALQVALFGFVVCSLSGGFSYTWWPYILIGLTVAAKRISDTRGAEQTTPLLT